MPGRGNAGFHEQSWVAELRHGQALHGDEPLRQLCRVRAPRHADAAATGRALQHHRKADLLAPLLRRVHIAKHIAARQKRHVGSPSQRPRFVLQAEAADVFRARADEGHPGRFQRLGESRVFAQKAVARVNRLGPRAGNRLQELGLVQVGLRHPPFAQRHRFSAPPPRAANRGPLPRRRPRSQPQARPAFGRCAPRSRRDWRPAPC